MDLNINSLSLQEKVGQRFMFGINSYNIDVIINLIKKYYIGGVILYKKNYKSYDEMLSVIKRIKEANKNNRIPLFIAIDQEGGRVNRMPLEFENIKNVYDMSIKDKKLLYDNGNITREMLMQTGINMNFAPVLDIYENNQSKVLYKRCFYGGIDDINEACNNYLEGIGNNCIVSVMKHFPGHGVSSMDSHFIIPCVNNYDKVLDKHIKPFEYAINKGIDALMVSHLVIKGMTDGLPASISSNFIKEYIRKRNNFNGLVITDDISMLSRNIFYRFNYMKRVFVSGSDIVLVKIRDSFDTKIIDEYFKFLSNHQEYVSLLDENVDRIITIKRKYNVNDDVSYTGCNISKINEKINKLNSLVI